MRDESTSQRPNSVFGLLGCRRPQNLPLMISEKILTEKSIGCIKTEYND